MKTIGQEKRSFTKIKEISHIFVWFLILYTFDFQKLYKTQVRELKEETDELTKKCQALQGDLQILQEERDSLSAQLELALAKAESEELARSIAEEQVSGGYFTAAKVQKGDRWLFIYRLYLHIW